MVNLPWE